MDQNAEQLRLLSIFHYIIGAIMALFSLFPVIHLAMGIAMVAGVFDNPNQGQPPPTWFGWFFILFALTFIVIGLAVATCVLIAGRNLSRRTGYMFCFVVACIECLFMPFGTILGVFTIVVLNRQGVRELFAPKG